MLRLKKMVVNEKEAIIGMDKEKDVVFLVTKNKTYSLGTWKKFSFWNEYQETKQDIPKEKIEHSKAFIKKYFEKLEKENEHYMYADRKVDRDRESQLHSDARKVLSVL